MKSNSYTAARDAYSALGVDTETALAALAAKPISLQCWQGDDVGGFEKAGATLEGGGIQATGNYPGKARTIAELRADLEQALKLIPGKQRLNLHACYADLGGRKVERNAYTAAHFKSWIDWCKAHGLGLDFNPTYFSHPLAADGFTLASPDAGVRKFWIEHGIACREIGATIGKALGTPSIVNFWVPDGEKDITADRRAPRERLIESYDQIFAKPLNPAHTRDAVESKLFGIGSESYVVGSHEFYLGYAVSRKLIVCLDCGHFHPTESIADKISSVLLFAPGVLLHTSRGVRWDSDHVVILDDPTRALFEEVVRGRWIDRVYIGLDFFDASINRVAAWVIGTRATQKALLLALLQPHDRLRSLELTGDRTARLALFEEMKTLPAGAIWEEFCRRHNVPPGFAWVEEIKRYERTVLAQRR